MGLDKECSRLAQAYRGKRDFFHVVWQVNTPRRKQRAESARTIFLLVGSPSYEKDLGLNTIKREVIEALVASNIGKAVRDNGHDYKLGSRISSPQLQKNRSSEAFRVIVANNQLKPTVEENIQIVHNAVGREVNRVLEPFIKRLKQRFRS